MTPRTEFADLRLRAKNLFDTMLLFLITLALLLVSACTLFLTVFITLFTVGRTVADQWKARVTVPKGTVPDVV